LLLESIPEIPARESAVVEKMPNRRLRVNDFQREIALLSLGRCVSHRKIPT